LQDLSGIM